MAKYKIKDGIGIIPDGTIIIESQAFEDCMDLEVVVIPHSVIVIKSFAFSGCSNLNNNYLNYVLGENKRRSGHN